MELCNYAAQSCELGINHIALPRLERRARHVRFTSDSVRTLAQCQTDALCHANAEQQTASLFDHLVRSYKQLGGTLRPSIFAAFRLRVVNSACVTRGE